MDSEKREVSPIEVDVSVKRACVEGFSQFFYSHVDHNASDSIHNETSLSEVPEEYDANSVVFFHQGI